MSALDDHFTRFLRERVYLHNVTPKTREFYETAWKAFQRSQQSRPARVEGEPIRTRVDLQEFIVHLSECGVKPV
jgi:hypothetical protein